MIKSEWQKVSKEMIDNTNLIKEKLLNFKDPADFYVCHVIQRAKDKKEDGTIQYA